MSPTIIIGRLRGAPVGLHWSVIGIIALVTFALGAARLPDAVHGYATWEYWAAAVITGVVFLGSIMAHELSHSVVAVREGLRVRSITLWLLGGAAQLEGQVASPAAEFRIAVSGPLVSTLFGLGAAVLAVALHAAGASPLIVETIGWLAGINIVLAIFNMIPAAPLDGGRVLRSALWAWKHDRTWSAVMAARAGRVFGGGLIGLGVVLFVGGSGGLWFVLLGWFILSVARAEEEQAVLESALTGVYVRDVMTPDPVVAPADIPVDRFLDEYVVRHRHATFPVVDASGAVTGLLTLRRLREQPHGPATTVREVACPVADVPTAAPGELLTEVIARSDERRADGRILVFDAGRLAGILSPVDLRRAIDVGAARQGHPQWTGR